MDLLISKFSSVWRGLNKEVSLSIKRMQMVSVTSCSTQVRLKVKTGL